MSDDGGGEVLRLRAVGAGTGALSNAPRRLAMKSSSCSAETFGRYALMDGTTAGAGAGFALAFVVFDFADFFAREGLEEVR